MSGSSPCHVSLTIQPNHVGSLTSAAGWPDRVQLVWVQQEDEQTSRRSTVRTGAASGPCNRGPASHKSRSSSHRKVGNDEKSQAGRVWEWSATSGPGSNGLVMEPRVPTAGVLIRQTTRMSTWSVTVAADVETRTSRSFALRHQITILERQLSTDARVTFAPEERAFWPRSWHRYLRKAIRRLRLHLRPDTVLEEVIDAAGRDGAGGWRRAVDRRHGHGRALGPGGRRSAPGHLPRRSPGRRGARGRGRARCHRREQGAGRGERLVMMVRDTPVGLPDMT